MSGIDQFGKKISTSSTPPELKIQHVSLESVNKAKKSTLSERIKAIVSTKDTEGIELRYEFLKLGLRRPVIIIRTRQGEQKIYDISSSDVVELSEVSRYMGLNKWEIREDLDLQLICTRGKKSSLEVIFYPYEGLKFASLLACLSILGLIIFLFPTRRNADLLIQIPFIALYIGLLCMYCKELWLFGTIRAWLFLSYPKVIFNLRGIEYIRGSKMCHISWNDIICLQRNFLGLSFSSKDGSKFYLPDRLSAFYPIIIKIIIEKTNLRSIHSLAAPMNWIAGAKWAKSTPK